MPLKFAAKHLLHLRTESGVSSTDAGMLGVAKIQTRQFKLAQLETRQIYLVAKYCNHDI